LQLLEIPQKLHFPANIIRLDNGLTLVHQQLKATPAVVADVWVRAGAISEPQEWSGMAHFLEHMIFKGTKRLGVGMFDQQIENLGGVTNAATSHDYAHFFLTTAADYLSEGLPYLAEILLQAEIPDEEFIRERDVVLEEIRASEDDPDWLGFQAMSETLYTCHPYGRSVLGTVEELHRHTPNQMRCFHATHYQPEQMTVALVGDIPQDKAVELVRESFSDFKVRSECPPTLIEAEPPLTGIRRNELVLPRLEIARLSMAWLGNGVEYLRDGVGLDLISVLLAGGRSSRLVRELREERQLVHDVVSAFSLQRDSSLFTISAYLDPECIEIVEEIVRDRVLELQHTPISKTELQRYQRILGNDYAFSTETPGQLAGLYGYYNTLAKAELAVTYPIHVQQLTQVELQQIASRYLSGERYVVTVVKPE
jgi:zinc protease